MEMKVDGRLIRSERERRAWSQEHLAQVAGLGRRTIQRIETTGLASYESAKALASVLELSMSSLRPEPLEAPERPGRQWSIVKPISALAASIVVAMSVLFAQSVFAKDVMLNIGLTLNDEDRGMSRLLTAEGKDAEVRVEGLMRLVVIPTIRDDGSIFLAAQVYESNGQDFVLISEPKVATANEKAAEIRISSDRGNSFRLLITPSLHEAN